MKREDNIYQIYVQILKEELVTAMGCTEPIAISYARKSKGGIRGIAGKDCSKGKRKHY